jgi:hypothetical protein
MATRTRHSGKIVIYALRYPIQRDKFHPRYLAEPIVVVSCTRGR